MINQLRVYLRQKSLEISGTETIESVVLTYLYQKFFGIRARVLNGRPFQDEEKLAFWGYIGLPASKKEEAKQLLRAILGKRQIKAGVHYSNKPLLLAGIFLVAKKISVSKKTKLLKRKIKENAGRFNYFDQFLLYTCAEIKPTEIYRGDIKNEDVNTLLALYALDKVFPGSVKVKVNDKDLKNLILERLALFVTTGKVGFGEVFLTEFFIREELKRAFRYEEHDAKSIVRVILKAFHDSIAKIAKKRRKNHSIFEVNDEYDVQDLLFVILKSLFPDIRPEDYTPKYGGSNKRIDLVIPSENIVIEVKMVRKGDNEKKFIKELNTDISNYHKHPNTKHLFGFVYDPHHQVINPHDFYELNGERSHKGMQYEVEIIINPR